MNENLVTKKDRSKRGGMVVGAILVAVGIMNLLVNVIKTEIEMYLVLATGVIFLMAGMADPSRGLSSLRYHDCDRWNDSTGCYRIENPGCDRAGLAGGVNRDRVIPSAAPQRT